ncbi:hypothetical protein BpHYR1_046369 [Brachionus plicatilis]|uniref:Uncharacterized protein n=1 Tax=Brachionus plicatilis TaxID=10195 RepID=A0A3M7P9Q2_BRAPC|nr:hypothetical protein BpHYR1_046369 [Brachionus plicatilis]
MPLFRHGALRQKLIVFSQNVPVNPAGQTQVAEFNPDAHLETKLLQTPRKQVTWYFVGDMWLHSDMGSIDMHLLLIHNEDQCIRVDRHNSKNPLFLLESEKAECAKVSKTHSISGLKKTESSSNYFVDKQYQLYQLDRYN